MRIATFWIAATILGTSTPVATAGEQAAPVLDALLPDGRITVALDEVAARPMLAPDQNIAVVELGRDARTSHHVVAIRNGEQPHRHDRHDLLVVILRGHGTMLLGALGGETRPLGPGSILYVPRGTVHAFRNLADSPAVAYAVYTPPFDGKDRVAAE